MDKTDLHICATRAVLQGLVDKGIFTDKDIETIEQNANELLLPSPLQRVVKLKRLSKKE